VAKQKTKKSDYEKALSAYAQAMKVFHKGDYKKAEELLKEFSEKYISEKELLDRTKVYLSICQEHKKDKGVQLKTFDDYYQYSIYKINQGEYEESLKLLNKASGMKPKEGKIFYLMADVYCMMGKMDKCLEYLKKAIQIDKYFKILAQNERDFEPLWEDKKFILITRTK
jgi:tetratricopeptide (TPR) repeat protein